MDFDAFERTIFQNWGNHYHCPTENLNQPGTEWIPIERWDGKELVRFRYVHRRTFLEFDPHLAGYLKSASAGRPAGTALRADDLAPIDGWKVIARDSTLYHYLYAADLPAIQPLAPFELRQLTAQDAGLMQALHAANPPAEVEAGCVEVDDDLAFGCLADGQLAAAASAFDYIGFMDVGVLTHPDYRKRGLGRAAVRALCAGLVERGSLPQYRCDAANIASVNLARSLNFRLYVTEEELMVRAA